MNQIHDRFWGVGPTGMIVTLVVWGLLIYVQDAIPLPRLKLSTGWKWSLTLVFLADGFSTLIWSLVTLTSSRYDQQLVTAGPYAFIRHPMYAALFLSGTGAVAFAFESWSVLLGVVPLHLWWMGLVRLEEQALIRRWGASYLTYAADTGQFFPSLTTLKKAFSESRHRDDTDL